MNNQRDIQLDEGNQENALTAFILKGFEREYKIDLSKQPEAHQRIKEEAKKVKTTLLSEQFCEINLPFIAADVTGWKHIKTQINRAEIEKITGKSFIDRSFRQIIPKIIPQPEKYSKDLANHTDITKVSQLTGSDSWFWFGSVIFTIILFCFGYLYFGTSFGNKIDGGLAFFLGIPCCVFVTWLIIKAIHSSDFNSTLEKIVSKRLNEENELAQKQENEFVKTVTIKAEQLYAMQKNNLIRLNQLLEQVEISIEQAQKLFTERAYTPFWDSIEDAVERLRQFDKYVSNINASAKEYYFHLKGRQHTFPAFPLKSEELPKPEALIKRLSERIAEAQRDFQFSSIFEQRRTTSAIIAGFRNTQEAINGLRDDVVSSLSDLQSSLESGLGNISSNISDGFENLAESQRQSAEELRETLDEASKTDAKHQKFTEGALDNIQNRRKPRMSETKEPWRIK